MRRSSIAAAVVLFSLLAAPLFAAAPVVTNVYPSTGPAAGETTVWIYGSNFVEGPATISFGSNAANAYCQSGILCSATAPAGAGTVRVAVTTAAGTSAHTPSSEFTYTVASCARFGSFQAFPATATGEFVQTVAVADFTGDGFNDMAAVWGYVPGYVTLFRGDGTGTSFVAGAPQALGNVLGTGLEEQRINALAADFNRDGRPDLAATNKEADTISILISNGQSFAAAVHVAVGNSPYALAAGDFNSDGWTDLAVAHSEGYIWIFLNTAGSFSSHTVVNSLIRHTAVAVADLDNDGNSDLLAAGTYPADSKDYISTFAGSGSGSFAFRTNTQLAYQTLSGLVSGDFTRDRLPDAAVTFPNIRLFLGDGFGGFAYSVTTNTAPDLPAVFITAADFNGDGDLDIATTAARGDEPERASILLGTGTGSFGAQSAYGWFQFPHGLTAGDLNRDGRVDLVVAAVGGPFVALNGGTGSLAFSSASASVNEYAGSLTLTVLRTGGTDCATTVDFTTSAGTAAPSLDYTETSGTLSFPDGVTAATFSVPIVDDGIHEGDETFQVTLSNPGGVPLGAASSATISIVDDDPPRPPVVSAIFPSSGPTAGGTEVRIVGSNFFGVTTISFGSNAAVAVNCISETQCMATAPAGAGTVGVTVTSGDGTSAHTPSSEFTYTVASCARVGAFEDFPATTTGELVHTVAVADFTGDGLNDMAAVWGNTQGYVTLLRRDGTGGSFVRVDPDRAVGNLPTSAVTADFNRDGRSDLAVTNKGSNTVSILINNNGLSFDAAVNVVVGTSPTSLAVGDFNGDGWTDFAVAHDDSLNIWIFLNTWGTFPSYTEVTSLIDHTSLAVADLNNDGISDLLAGGTYVDGYDYVSTFLGDGNGFFAFQDNTPLPGGSSPAMAVADVNNDGKSDAAVTITQSSLGILLGDGAGNFGSAVPWPAGFPATKIAVADFDGDGVLDIAAASAEASGRASILLGTGDGSFGEPMVYGPFPWSPRGVTAADLNHDGRTDLVLAAAGGPFVALNRFSTGALALSSATASVDEGAGSVTLTVERTGGTDCAATVDYTTSAGTATAGVDYTETGGTLTFADGAASADITIPIINNAVHESPETFVVTLSNPGGGATLGATASVTVSIVDDDTAGITVEPTAVTVSEGGSTATFTVRLQSEPAANVVIDIVSGDPGEAAVSPAQLAFTSENWSTNRTVTVTGADDTLDDGDQSSVVALTVSAGDADYTAIDPADVTVSTTDDDGAETATVLLCSPNPSAIGQTVSFTATVTSGTAGTITGTVAFHEGEAVLATLPLSGGSALFTTSDLSAGSHSLTAHYSGDANFAASTSAALDHVVNSPPPNAPASFGALATSTSAVQLAWSAVTGATGYEIHSSTGGSSFSLLTLTPGLAYLHSDLTADTTYLYMVRAISPSGVSPFTAVDPATTILFSDSSLAGLPVRAVHFTELRRAVNAMRAAASLPAAVFTDGTLVPGTTLVKAAHLVELRTALTAARQALGLAEVSNTDPVIETGTTLLKAAHVHEIRAGVQ